MKTRLTLISEAGKSKHGAKQSLYRCVCGIEKIIVDQGVNSGKVISCGCYHKERNAELFSTHRKTKDPLFRIWRGMKYRCERTKSINFAIYGGRGIRVCDEWQDVEAFIRWANQNGYVSGLQIDRINNDGEYSPSNCRWVTVKVNSNNRRTNLRITFNGQNKTLQEWADSAGINKGTLRNRLVGLKWPTEKALSEPIIQKFKPKKK
jgi:hypothetical protein